MNKKDRNVLGNESKTRDSVEKSTGGECGKIIEEDKGNLQS